MKRESFISRQSFFSRVADFFHTVFHTRNFIIVSAHKTHQIQISGWLQCATVSASIVCLLWASFSTGGYVAARNDAREKEATLRSVANSRVETNFNYRGPSLQASAPVVASPGSGAGELFNTPHSPSYAFASEDQNGLYARIAMLEGRVQALKSANQEIVETVRKKTNGKIADLEEVIRETGLNPDRLKQQVYRQQKKQERQATKEWNESKGRGGPYVPDDFSDIRTFEQTVGKDLDQLVLLHSVVNVLPLGKPIKNASTESGFGRRIDPFTGRIAFHAGVDLAGPTGSQIYATANGIITSAEWNGAYGNAVDIDHGYGIKTRYGHLSRILVDEGDYVRKGQAIGIEGSTGRSTGAHLHYEVRYNDKPMDPSNFIKAGHNVL